MSKGKETRAAHRGDGGDPRETVLLGGEQRSFSEFSIANQQPAREPLVVLSLKLAAEIAAAAEGVQP